VLSIGIVVTNFNTWDITKRCVDSCVKLDRPNFQQLLVYDDGSTTPCDVTFPEGTNVHMASTNVGLTKVLNSAFRMMHTDVVVLFDSDATPLTPFCEEVRRSFSDDSTLGLLGLRTVDEAGNATEFVTSEPNQWSLILGQSLFARYAKLFADKSGKLSVFTCAMAVRMKSFDELGGFDEKFDWLDLDHDFSMRINRSRWKTRVCTAVRIFHKGGGTPQRTSKRVLRFYKNRWYLLKKFERISNLHVARHLILLRLSLELIFLKSFGSYYIRDVDILKDKVEGRRDLLRCCKQSYLDTEPITLKKSA
jgi:GT2 family glycosyltransferase